MEGSIDRIAEESLLYDLYGGLLSPRQGQIVELYTQENLSLAEISEELGISRQAVHDALRNGQRSLERYEDKLGLVKRLLRTEEAIEEIDNRILGLIDDARAGGSEMEAANRQLISELRKIKSIIDGLED